MLLYQSYENYQVQIFTQPILNITQINMKKLLEGINLNNDICQSSQVKNDRRAIEGIEQSFNQKGFLAEKQKGGGLDIHNMELLPKSQKIQVNYQKNNKKESKKIICKDLILGNQLKQNPKKKKVQKNIFFGAYYNKNKGRIIDILQQTKMSKMNKQKQHRYQQISDSSNEQRLIKLNKIKKDDQTILDDKQRRQLTQYYYSKKTEIINRQSTDEKRYKIEKEFKDHTSKGKNFKFTYDLEGELLLFKQKQYKNQLQSSNYRIISQEEESKKDMQMSRTFFSVKSAKLKKQFHRTNSLIKFTSLGLTNAERDDDFTLLQANDDSLNNRRKIFSNNEMRQTTNISFFKVKQGTQYSELTNNVRRYSTIGGIQTKPQKFKTKKSGYSLHSSLMITKKKDFTKYELNDDPPKQQNENSINKIQYDKNKFQLISQRIRSQPTFRMKSFRDRISIKNAKMVKDMLNS